MNFFNGFGSGFCFFKFNKREAVQDLDFLHWSKWTKDFIQLGFLNVQWERSNKQSGVREFSFLTVVHWWATVHVFTWRRRRIIWLGFRWLVVLVGLLVVLDIVGFFAFINWSIRWWRNVILFLWSWWFLWSRFLWSRFLWNLWFLWSIWSLWWFLVLFFDWGIDNRFW